MTDARGARFIEEAERVDSHWEPTPSYQGDGEAKSEGECVYTIVPEPLPRRKLNYPGYEAFLPSEHRGFLVVSKPG